MTLQELYDKLEELIVNGKGDYDITYDDGYVSIKGVEILDSEQSVNLTW